MSLSSTLFAFFLVTVSLFLIIPSVHSLFFINHDDEEGLTFEQIIARRGYKLMSHPITTEDGYYLTLHRIVPPNFGEKSWKGKYRKPVLLGHCLSGSAVDFFINSPHDDSLDISSCSNNLGICLVSKGYDVWAMNFRGNEYSQGSSGASANNPLYWDFSMDEFAEQDLPAAISYIQRKTGIRSIGYVGHGHGAGAMFSLLAQRRIGPETINPFVAMTPMVYFSESTSILVHLTPQIAQGLALVPHKFLLNNMLTIAGLGGCKTKFFDSSCLYAYRQLFGESIGVNHTRSTLYISFFPSSTSMIAITHMAQLYLTGEFRRYSPPNRAYLTGGELINLRDIHPDMNIFVLSGKTDSFVVPKDAFRLVTELGSVVNRVVHMVVPAAKFNYLDFLFGEYTSRFVNEPILDYLDWVQSKEGVDDMDDVDEEDEEEDEDEEEEEEEEENEDEEDEDDEDKDDHNDKLDRNDHVKHYEYSNEF